MDNKQIKKYLKEQGVTYKKHQDFLIEYINNGGNATKAYKKAVSSYVTDASAAVMGSNILKKLNIVNLMDFMGHGPDKMNEALNRLLLQDPKEYLKYYSKFRQLENNTQTVNLSGSVEVRNITFTADPGEAEDE